MASDEVMAAGTLLDVELRLPDRSTPIRFLGAVVWSKPGWAGELSKGPVAETGIQFVSIDPADRTAVMHDAKAHPLPPISPES